MTSIQHQIRRAQHRLWLNRWLHQGSFCLAIGAVGFAIIVLVQRLFDLPLPLMAIGFLVAVGAGLASVVWLSLTREDKIRAAAALDQAAGLRERLSSGQYCHDSDDPFARAVVADADRISASIAVRQHLRLTTPPPLPWTGGAVLLAAMMFLITPGLLKSTAAEEDELESQLVEQTRAVVTKKMESVRKMTEGVPALQDLEDDLGQLEEQSGGMLREPTDIRHEAVKKIDRLADAVKKKREAGDYDKLDDVRRMMRRLDAPKSPTAPTEKLNRALQQGDFKSAKEEVEALREQLATLKAHEDKEMVEQLSRQLDQLAEKLEKITIDEKLAQQLEQAGINKEEIDRMLEKLSKKDLEQLQKKLQEKGLSQQQVDQIAKQLQMQQRGMKGTQQLAKGMRNAAQAAAAGQTAEAAADLSQTGQQLSELEQLEQEMNQLDSTLADLQNARNDIDKPCPT